MVEKGHHPWERFKHWIHSICVVNFDLELGQTIEVIYPGDAHLTPIEKSNICYLAFPDSNSSCTGDTDYFFRVQRVEEGLTEAQWQFSNGVSVSMQPDPRFYYGFVHFRQMKDPSLPRGYFQKSLVLLTVLPLFGLFSYVIETIAYGFFDMGEAAVLSACEHIDQWPLPIPGETLNLFLLGALIQCRIPSKLDAHQKPMPIDFPHITSSTVSQTVQLPVIHEINFYESIKPVLSHIHLLWELVLLGEPLVVLAATPAQCTHLVQSLVSMIYPLKYCSDFRPFFTIHDSDFSEIASKHARPNMILGVTNPFFSKALQHWPHIYRVGDTNAAGHTAIANKLFKKNWDGRTLESKPGFVSQYKPFLQPGNGLMKKLLKVGKRPDSVQNAILRKHFIELTQSFLFPLERYVSSLLPLKRHITPFKALPQIKPFILDDFLKSLQQAGPHLTSLIKGDWDGLYKLFVKSTNFNGWLRQRLNDVEYQLKETHLEVLCTADLSPASLSTKQQVEIVDLVLKLRDRIVDLNGNSDKRSKLQKQLDNILASVDDELKSVLLSNCALREVFEI